MFCRGVFLSNVCLCFASRYFYRACQGTLFPSPVQVGRQLDKLPYEIRRNILSLSGVKAGSPLGPKPHFLSLGKTSFSNKKQQHTDSEKELPSADIDTLPYTKDAAPPASKDCLDQTLDASSWITSTPLLSPSDGIQFPPDGDSFSVKYSRNSEERLKSDQTS